MNTEPKTETLDERAARFRAQWQAAENERNEAASKALREQHRASEAARRDADAKAEAERQSVRAELATECGFANPARDRRRERLRELIAHRASRLGPGERAGESYIDMALHGIEVDERQERGLLDEMVEMTIKMRTAPAVVATPLELPRDCTTGLDDVLVLWTTDPPRWEVGGYYVRSGSVVPASSMASPFGEELRARIAYAMKTRLNAHVGAWLVPVSEGLAGACKTTGLPASEIIEAIAGRPLDGVPGAALLAYRWVQSVHDPAQRKALESIATKAGPIRRVEYINRTESHHETLQRIRKDHEREPDRSDLAAWWTEVEAKAKVK